VAELADWRHSKFMAQSHIKQNNKSEAKTAGNPIKPAFVLKIV
jgi:hypothetical protein